MVRWHNNPTHFLAGGGEGSARRRAAAGRPEEAQHHHRPPEAATQQREEAHHGGVAVRLGDGQGAAASPSIVGIVADVQLLLTMFKRQRVLPHHHHHQESLSRGEKLSLKSNSDPENWDVICPDGSAQSFPAVCFQIPPPDPEATDRVNLYVLQSAVHGGCTMEKLPFSWGPPNVSHAQ